jgi:hypothetical protein
MVTTELQNSHKPAPQPPVRMNYLFGAVVLQPAEQQRVNITVAAKPTYHATHT